MQWRMKIFPIITHEEMTTDKAATIMWRRWRCSTGTGAYQQFNRWLSLKGYKSYIKPCCRRNAFHAHPITTKTQWMIGCTQEIRYTNLLTMISILDSSNIWDKSKKFIFLGSSPKRLNHRRFKELKVEHSFCCKGMVSSLETTKTMDSPKTMYEWLLQSIEEVVKLAKQRIKDKEIHTSS